MDCSTPSFPVHQQLMKLAQTHVHKHLLDFKSSLIGFNGYTPFGPMEFS